MLKNHPSLAFLAFPESRFSPKLSPSRHLYFIPLRHGFFSIVSAVGVPLALKAHLLRLYYAPDAKTVSDASIPSNLVLQQFTASPFVFHDTDNAIRSITNTLIEISETYE